MPRPSRATWSASSRPTRSLARGAPRVPAVRSVADRGIERAVHRRRAVLWSPAMRLVDRARAALCTMLAATQPDVADRPLGADGFRVTRSWPHDATASTQGLAWADGELYESTGLYGASTLRRVDLASGEVQGLAVLPRQSFGEGLAVVGERVVQLTWREGRAIVYDRNTLSPVASFRYRGEGWGLCFDGARLLMSDGTSRLRLLDPRTFAERGALDVRCAGRPLERLNDLTVAGNEIIANVHGLDRLARLRARWHGHRLDRSPAPAPAGGPWRARAGRERRHVGCRAGAAAGDRQALAAPVRDRTARRLARARRRAWRCRVSAAPVLRARERAPSITLHRSIREVPRGEWDALADDDVLASHGWLATIERARCGGAAPLYVAARSAGRLVGAAACVRMHATDAIETIDHVLLGRLRPLAARLGISFLPALVAAPLRGFGCLPLLSRELAGHDPRRRPGRRSRRDRGRGVAAARRDLLRRPARIARRPRGAAHGARLHGRARRSGAACSTCSGTRSTPTCATSTG